MRRIILLLPLCILLCTNVQALDNNTYYGDGVTVSFSEIRSSLPTLYRNTPTISVSTASGVKTYSFNVEMFIDKGYLVYGNPSSVMDLAYINSFKSKNDGYFYSSGYGSERGEYRYLGLSINGTVYTNIAFPSDTVTGEHEYRVVKYSSLPDYLKQRYGITKDGNAYFEGIRHLIDSPAGPAWNFIHTYSNGNTVTVYDKFKDSGLVGNNINSASIFDYARITGWGSGGGSLVLYYRSINDGSVYRYATFTGDINPIWAKGFPGLSCEIVIEIDSYKIDAQSDSVTLNYRVTGTLNDNYSNLSDILKRYTYTRDDILSYMLYNKNTLVQTACINLHNDKVVFYSENINLELNRDSLNVGYNTIKIIGMAKVNAQGCIFTSGSSHEITVYVEPEYKPTPTPVPTPQPTPTPTIPPTNTPKLKRRW